jgi:hypothetical protein
LPNAAPSEKKKKEWEQKSKKRHVPNHHTNPQPLLRSLPISVPYPPQAGHCEKNEKKQLSNKGGGRSDGQKKNKESNM